MRLLHLQDDDKLSLTRDLKSNIPRYGILSHTWGPDEEEVTFDDLRAGKADHKAGFAKILLCGKWARGDGLEYIWVDSCCIDKSSSAELSEAIISMFAWYKHAAKCYVYLSDLDIGGNGIRESIDTKLRECRWFTRGWTLQELLAPVMMEFHSSDGRLLGDKQTLGRLIQEITTIPWSALQGADLSAFSISERMNWAARRTTTRAEDRAYCLLGLFQVYIPVMYGEGAYAFVRLEDEIERRSQATANSTRVPSRRRREVEELEMRSATILEGLPVAKQAAYNVASKQDDPLCLPDTRVEVLKRIKAWVYGEEQSCIFWLNGMAGTGKSTIARTIAREFDQRGDLGASFFFSRGDGDVAHAGLFFTTIAKQLAKSSPTMKQELVRALEEEPDLPNKTRFDQWNDIIAGPLDSIPSCATKQVVVVVVDALDECDNDNDVEGIIKLLSQASGISSITLRFVVTSRPEMPIRLGFKLMPHTLHEDLLLHHERRDVVDADICLYMYDQFEKVKMMQEWLDEDWPGINTVNRLVQLAGGLFIVAATVCRCILEDDGRGADGALDLFLHEDDDSTIETTDNDDDTGGSSTRSLDRLYARVLGKSTRLVGPVLYTLSTIAALCEPLSATALARVLAVRPADIHRQLSRLHSVMHVPSRGDDPIRMVHSSFRDFLLNEKRCSVIVYDSGMEARKELHVETQQLHEKLALQCLRLLSKADGLRRDLCSINRPGVRRNEVDEGTIKTAIPSDMSYACRYWVHHLQQSGQHIQDDGEVHRFLRDYWLYWIEALSWLGWVSRSHHLLDTLQRLTKRGDEVGSFVRDAKRFLLSNRSIAETAPLQLYCSALIFAPSQCLIRKQFHRQTMVSLDIQPDVPDTYGPELFKLEVKDFVANSVCVSTDGQLVASGSVDSTVCIWNISSGALLQRLEGWVGTVNVVTFSADGRRLAAGLDNGNIWVWMTSTGDLFQRLVEGVSAISALAFISDGSQIVSVSLDGIAQVWNAAGQVVHQFGGSANPSCTVAISPQDSRIATSSLDNVISTWDALTREHLRSATSHVIGDDFCVCGMAFKPDGQLVVISWHMRTYTLRAVVGARSTQYFGHVSVIACVASSPEVRKVTAAARDRSIRVWDFETGQQLQVLIGHEGPIRSLAFSSDEQLLLSASHDGTVRVWDVATCTPVQPARGSQSYITSLQFSPNGQQVAVISSGRLELWDALSGQQIASSEGEFCRSRAMSFSPDGQLIAAPSDDLEGCKISIWNPETGQRVWELQGSGSPISHLAFSPDGRLLVACYITGVLEMWQLATAESTFFLPETLGKSSSMIFSPDGTMIALRGQDHSVQVVDVMAREMRLWLQHERGQLNCSHGIAFSADSTMFAEGMEDMLTIWCIAAKQPIATLRGEGGGYTCVAFSAAGSSVAAHSQHFDTIEIWNIGEGQRTRLIGGSQLVDSMSFFTDDRYLDTNIGRLSLVDDAVPGPIWFAGSWTRYKGEDTLWLPYGYCGYNSICHDRTIVLGRLCGEPLFIRFAENQSSSSIGTVAASS